MKTSKLVIVAAAFALMAILSTGAMAQKGSAGRLPPEPIFPVVKVNAIEVTDGNLGMDYQNKSETMFGYSFLGRTTGALPGSFTLSMNCTPAFATPGGVTQLTGGSWTLPVYLTDIKGSGYAGALFGTIAKGSMSWDKTGTSATVYIVLNVDGGTQAWDGVRGYATFAGILFVDEKTEETVLTGDMVFNTISADLGKVAE